MVGQSGVYSRISLESAAAREGKNIAYAAGPFVYHLFPWFLSRLFLEACPCIRIVWKIVAPCRQLYPTRTYHYEAPKRVRWRIWHTQLVHSICKRERRPLLLWYITRSATAREEKNIAYTDGPFRSNIATRLVYTCMIDCSVWIDPEEPRSSCFWICKSLNWSP